MNKEKFIKQGLKVRVYCPTAPYVTNPIYTQVYITLDAFEKLDVTYMFRQQSIFSSLYFYQNLFLFHLTNFQQLQLIIDH